MYSNLSNCLTSVCTQDKPLDLFLDQSLAIPVALFLEVASCLTVRTLSSCTNTNSESTISANEFPGYLAQKRTCLLEFLLNMCQTGSISRVAM